MALDDALGQHEAPVAETDRQVDEEVAVVFFAAEVEVVTARLVGQLERPLHLLGEDVGHLLRRVAVAVDAADKRAHTVGRDRVDRDAQLLEDLQRAYVCCAARAAATQYEADARAFRLGGCGLSGRILRGSW